MKKEHESNAERQRAYRQRLRQKLLGNSPAPVVLVAKPKRKASRPQRLELAARELQALLDEYEAWLERMPENLVDGADGERLRDTIEQLQTAIEAIEAIEVPKGFGR